ncbi:hypothetical protein CC1G_06413 [Coprinopsis cinerea okayama7|uniref:SH3 domain-containing protein n=1 Tax=Coprinopsis cinerea (strain Okayama-7 / 130 / ATCC MYA-4618 / FGSC 9003) TaxID=240176 RepID=A8NTX8_COPC7|nr:hypothetical protein CC1G_06413 [Coprinopsis cinerea okayama7\|eukprot:XP_001836328.1 hypothetical protein CC1G_06413 [Coprinopsis cinerea okayama7\
MPSIINKSTLERRAEGDSGLNGVYIAGIVVVALLLFCVGTWLLIRWNRQRNKKKREETSAATFLSVRGLMREAPSTMQEKMPSPPSAQAPPSSGFSRSQRRPTIVIPDRALTPRVGAGSRDDIINFHRQSDNFPKPFSFALNRSPVTPPGPNSGNIGPLNLSPQENNRSSWIRHSFFSNRSSMAIGNRYSVTSSSSSSFGAEPTTGATRKVRQLFTPVLPDELLLTKTGEQLTVIQSFDDGWCVVGRENASSIQHKKSLFPDSTGVAGNDVELGVVPAWCFLKPVKGLRAERPVRSTSLGITVQMDAPGNPSRNDLISWSNF